MAVPITWKSETMCSVGLSFHQLVNWLKNKTIINHNVVRGILHKKLKSNEPYKSAYKSFHMMKAPSAGAHKDNRLARQKGYEEE